MLTAFHHFLKFSPIHNSQDEMWLVVLGILSCCHNFQAFLILFPFSSSHLILRGFWFVKSWPFSRKHFFSTNKSTSCEFLKHNNKFNQNQKVETVATFFLTLSGWCLQIRHGPAVMDKDYKTEHCAVKIKVDQPKK